MNFLFTENGPTEKIKFFVHYFENAFSPSHKADGDVTFKWCCLSATPNWKNIDSPICDAKITSDNVTQNVFFGGGRDAYS